MYLTLGGFTAFMLGYYCGPIICAKDSIVHGVISTLCGVIGAFAGGIHHDSMDRRRRKAKAKAEYEAGL